MSKSFKVLNLDLSENNNNTMECINLIIRYLLKISGICNEWCCKIDTISETVSFRQKENKAEEIKKRVREISVGSEQTSNRKLTS